MIHALRACPFCGYQKDPPGHARGAIGSSVGYIQPGVNHAFWSEMFRWWNSSRRQATAGAWRMLVTFRGKIVVPWWGDIPATKRNVTADRWNGAVFE